MAHDYRDSVHGYLGLCAMQSVMVAGIRGRGVSMYLMGNRRKGERQRESEERQEVGVCV